MAVLPTGYGKSIIFHLLPALLHDKIKMSGQSPSRPVVIVVSPLNALSKDQIRRISQGTLKAAALRTPASVEQARARRRRSTDLHHIYAA